MPRPLCDGILFLTACDVDFILKCEWIHIGRMLTCRKRKYTMTHSIHDVCHMKHAQIWGHGENYVLWRHIHGSAENVARAVWMNDASQTKIR